jgi:hypothetical protein
VELLSGYPDAEDIGLALFASAGSTVLATPVLIVPPLIVVRRVGGGDDGLTDRPRLQVQTFGASRATARDLAEECRQLVTAAAATAVAGALIDRTGTESSPVYLDYGDPAVHRYLAIYRLEYRRSR